MGWLPTGWTSRWMVADLFFLSILLVFTVRGLFKGLVREVFSLLGLLTGMAVAYRYSPLLMAGFEEASGGVVSLPYPLAFGLVLVSVVFFFHVIGLLLSLLFDLTRLSFINRVLGGGIGLLKGLVLAMVVAAVIGRLPEEWTGGWIEGSILFDTLMRGVELVKDLTGGVL